MDRVLKRVPLGFSYPLQKIWDGYINPCPPFDCKKCYGTGYNEATRKLKDDWYAYSRSDGREGWGLHLEQEDVDALLERDRLWHFTRVPINKWQLWVVLQKRAAGGNSWLPFNNGYHPTAKEVNAWARKGIGHDALNRNICVEARAKRMEIYGLCDHCNGEGVWYVNDRHKKCYEEWEPYDPPEGEGFQLWENTSEGSPISPVFKSLEELCAWCEPNATVFGSKRATAMEWRKMLEDGSVYHQEGHNIFL